ncbi:MAG TPA: amidohydrolase [Acidimicrobiia bacterium]|nr:amidohydrolase [Acidimicrobiia bacterium]
MPADLIISGGEIITGIGNLIEAVAIEGPTIRATGTRSELRRLVGRHTDHLDLESRVLVPGFIDAHVHPLTGGLKLGRCALEDAGGAVEALAMVAQYAELHPDEEWIWGGGWSLAWFRGGTPDAASLDRVTGDRPAYLEVADGHAAWVNSAALRLAGIDAGTPDPADGRIERHPDGSPQGTLHEGAMSLVEQHLPPPSSSEWEAALLAGQEYLLSCGIVGWQDAIVEPQHHQAYLAVAGRGALKAHVVGALWWDRHRSLDQIEELVARRAQMVPGYRATAVKLMLDGIAENFTAALLDEYLDSAGRPSGNTGIDFIDPHDLKTLVTHLDRLGFQCHFHAIGNRAVRNALDAVEAAQAKNGRSDLRHHIAHLQLVASEDRVRLAELGVAANAQALWAAHEPQMDQLTIPFLPEHLRGDQYPLADIVAAGARLGMGSDWSVSTADVMQQIEVATTRVAPHDRRSSPYAPHQALTVEQALAGFTAGSAWINGWEATAGTIEAGRRADFAILAANPLSERPIGDITVEATIIGGEVVFQRGLGGS